MKATRAQEIKIAELNTWVECYDAVRAIGADPRNVKGGMRAWCSGYETELTAAAQRKVEAIERKMEKLEEEEEF